MDESIFVPLIAIPVMFVGLPWLILHYITRWKTNGSMTVEDENLLDELHDIARRLDDRVGTIERIIAADREAVPPPVRLAELRPDFRPDFRALDERAADIRTQPIRKDI